MEHVLPQRGFYWEGYLPEDAINVLPIYTDSNLWPRSLDCKKNLFHQCNLSRNFFLRRVWPVNSIWCMMLCCDMVKSGIRTCSTVWKSVSLCHSHAYWVPPYTYLWEFVVCVCKIFIHIDRWQSHCSMSLRDEIRSQSVTLTVFCPETHAKYILGHFLPRHIIILLHYTR